MSDRPSMCAGCGAPITWRYTPAGQRMPLDVQEDRYVVDQSWYVIVDETHCRPAEPMFDAPETVYHRSHWATCPVADVFKEPRRRKEAEYGSHR